MRRSKLVFLASVFSLAMFVAAGPAHAQASHASSVPTTDSNARLPVTAFARLPFIDGAKLSPNGEMIAGQFAVNGEQRFVVMALFGSGKRFQAALPDNLEVDGVRWVGNDNVIMSVRSIQSVTGSDRLYVSRLMAFNLTTEKFTRLLSGLAGQNASDILWIPTDGTTRILVTGQNSIYVDDNFWPTVYSVDVATGKHTEVDGPSTDVMDWIADSQGVVRAKVAVDRMRGRRTLFYRKGKKETFAKIASTSFDALNVPVLFIPGESKALIVRKSADGISALVEIDVETGQELLTLFQAPEGREIDSVRADDAGNTVLGVRLGGEQSGGLHWIDPELAKLQEAFGKSLKDRRGEIISLSADRNRMLVLVDRADEPGRLYYFDVAGGTMQAIAYVNPDITKKATAKVSTIRYKARDGLEIEAILHTPPGREAKALPVVVMPHGGPWGHDTMNWDYWAQFVASRGYLVIQPNFRGSTGYGDEFVGKGLGQMGLAMQDDVNDALVWATKEGLADPKRACLVGASYGGYVAMWGVARDPDLWRCTVSIAGVANLRREVNDFGGNLYAKRYREQWQAMTPDFAAVSPIKFIDRIKVPMLLIHGKKDLTVDHVQSKSMYDKMKSAGKDVEFLSLPNADHFFTREADRVALLTAIEGFLGKHNPAD